MDLVTSLSDCQTKVQLRSKTARAQSGLTDFFDAHVALLQCCLSTVFNKSAPLESSHRIATLQLLVQAVGFMF